MTDSLNLGKRAFTTAVAAATILWSVGISAFVSPLTAQAAVAGDLIKGTSLSTLYYYGSDGSRYAFPNEKTFFTWHEDFSGIVTMSDSALAAIPLAGNIVYRPGVRWIKIMSDPKTYAVTPQGQIRWIESEAVAMDLAGSDWNMSIDDVPDTFFVDYTVGPSLMDAGDAFNGALVSMGGSEYLVWDGEKRMITDAGWDGNNYQDRALLDGTGMDLAGLSSGSSLSGEESMLTDDAQLGDEVTGGLSVSLASDTPASATVPAGASSVPFTKVKLSATSGSASVSQLIFKLGGVGTVDNIADVYLYEGDMRVTDGRSVNSSTREVTFSGLDIDLDSGETVYLTVRADISDAPTGGDTASFALSSEGSVVSTATVSGSFPVSGNTMTFSETMAGTLVVTESGSVSDPTIGEEDAVIAKFDVEAEDEDASIEQITVNVDKGGDHSGYQLWNDDDLLATGQTNSDSDLITFVLTNPLEIEEGDSEGLEITADIGGEADDDIKVAIEEEADVLAMGGDYGFNLAIDISEYSDTGSACAGSGDFCSFSTIIGGELTFAFNGPSTDDIQVDGDDQVLMEFTITAENWTEIKELSFEIQADEDDGSDDDDLINSGDSEANLQDITLRTENGSTWMGPEEFDLDGDDFVQGILFDDNQILETGESIDLMLTVDVDSGATPDEVYFATLLTEETSAEDANGDDLDTAEDVVPSADIVGNDFTLTDASLDVTRSTPPSSGTFVKGASNVDVVGFTFEAGNASDIVVTEIGFDAFEDGGNDVGDHVSSCSIYDSTSGSLIDGPESLDSDDFLQFDSFDWAIEAGETAKMYVRCNFSNTDTVGGDDFYAFELAEADIVAEDDDGDDVDASVDDGNTGWDTQITIIDSGDLTVTLDGGTAKSTIILGSSTGVAMSKFKFDASDEAFTVTTLTFENCLMDDNGDVEGAEDCSSGYGEDGSDDVAAAVKISYEDESGATRTKTGFLSGGSVTFDNIEFYVPTDSTEVLTVTIDTSAVSDTGAASGSDIQLNVDAFNKEFEAVGASSGETIDENDVDSYVVANDMTVRKTKPTFSLASGSPSGAGVPGLSEVFRFNVSADSRGFVELNALTFKITSTDGAGSGWNECGSFDDSTLFEIYNIDDSSEKLDDDDSEWYFIDDSVSDDSCTGAEDVKYAVYDFSDNSDPSTEEIGAGQTETYVLRIDTTGASSTDDDSIRVDIIDESEADDSNEGVCSNAYGCGLDAISWNDDSEATFIDGTFIKNLPVTGGTIVY